MDRKEIAAVLEEMGTLLELQGANPFKARAFHNPCRAVDGLTQDIAALIDSGELLDVKGIGKSIATIITDLLKSGSSDEYTQLGKGTPEGLLQMVRIPGLGPKRVKILYEKLNLKSIDQLESAARANKLSSLDGFGEKIQ